MLAVAGIILYFAYDLILKSKLEPAISNITAGINLFEKQEEARPGEIYHPSVKLCTDTANNRIVELKGKDRYLHTLVVGSTGTGKTTTVLAPMIWQDLQNMLKGHRLGITVVAPDGEFCYQVEDWCKRLGVPYHFIDLDNPNSDKFNPLAEGDPNVVSEIMRTVLRATFGEQEAFFAQAQELHAKNTMLLLKKLMGNKLTMLDVYESLMDLDKVKEQVEGYKSIYGEDILTTYFEKEAFGRNKEKLHQFAMGLRLQISDLLHQRCHPSGISCRVRCKFGLPYGKRRSITSKHRFRLYGTHEPGIWAIYNHAHSECSIQEKRDRVYKDASLPVY